MGKVRHAIRNVVLDVRRFLHLFSRLDREAVAAHYLRGTGLEIGALHNPLKVPSAVTVHYVDRMPVAELRNQYPELASHNLVEADIIDDGERLTTVGDATQDFVIANHFIEHCENPIDTLMNLVRVLKNDGILFMCVPDKRYTFDSERTVTPFEHLVKDYTDGPSWSREGHFREWVRHVEHVANEGEAEARVRHLMETKYSIHYHVWTEMEMMEMFVRLKERFQVPLEPELMSKSNGEVVWILSKTA
jgi:predicted SAM-dependent methyltransferase